MTRRLRRRWLAVGGGVLLLAAALVAAAGLQPPSGTWARVVRDDLVIGADIEGELEAVESAALGPPPMREVWNFKISFMAPEGTEVREGMPVLGFDTTELQQRLLREMAERDSTQKQLEKAVTDAEKEERDLRLRLEEARSGLRKAELKLATPDVVVARTEVEKARIDRHLAELEVSCIESKREHRRISSEAGLEALRERRDRAAAKVVELESQIGRMTVKAPRSGTIIHKSNWRGEKKKIGDSAWRAETVLEIPDLARMRAQAEVAEADAGRVEEGQRVGLRLEAHPDQEYHGVVRSIRRSVQQRSWRNPEKVVRIEIDLGETDQERMRPGMRFRGRVVADEAADTLVVPQEAVTLGPEGASVTIRTLLGQRQVRPRLGRRNSEYFEVMDGLGEGDRVLLGGKEED